MIRVNVTDFRRQFLRNLPLEDHMGVPLGDEDLLELIHEATADFEREYAVRLEPTVIKVGPHPLDRNEPYTQSNPPEGATAEEIAALPKQEIFDSLPYDPRAFEGSRHANLRLPIGPVRQVYGVGLELPGRLDLYQLPDYGVHLNIKRKSIQIYWKAGFDYHPILAASAVGFHALSSGRTIPNTWNITYLAGYTEEELLTREADVRASVLKTAAIKALIVGSFDRNAALGVAGRNVSADGLSQQTQLIANAQTLKYGPLIAAYREEIKAFESMFSYRKAGVKLGVL
jgi:hypothetical protein